MSEQPTFRLDITVTNPVNYNITIFSDIQGYNNISLPPAATLRISEEIPKGSKPYIKRLTQDKKTIGILIGFVDIDL